MQNGTRARTHTHTRTGAGKMKRKKERAREREEPDDAALFAEVTSVVIVEGEVGGGGRTERERKEEV